MVNRRDLSHSGSGELYAATVLESLRDRNALDYSKSLGSPFDVTLSGQASSLATVQSQFNEALPAGWTVGPPTCVVRQRLMADPW